jgi:hypothetical protein
MPHMIESHEFPAEFPADPAGGTDALRWTTTIIALTALALALLNPEAIVAWTRELPAAPSTVHAMTAADAWHAGSAGLGLDAPRTALHRAWQRAEAARWPQGAGERPPR